MSNNLEPNREEEVKETDELANVEQVGQGLDEIVCSQDSNVTFDSTTNLYGPYRENILDVPKVPHITGQDIEDITGGLGHQAEAHEPQFQHPGPNANGHQAQQERRRQQVLSVLSYRTLVQRCVESEGEHKVKDFLRLAGSWVHAPCISNNMQGLDGENFICPGTMEVKIMRDRNGLQVPHLACNDCDGVTMDGVTIQRRMVGGCSAVMGNTFCGACQQPITPTELIVPGNTTLETKLVSIHVLCMVLGQTFKAGHINTDTDVCACASKTGTAFQYGGWCKICRGRVVAGQYGMAPPAGTVSIGCWNHRDCELQSQLRAHRRQTERIMYELKARVQSLRPPNSKQPNYVGHHIRGGSPDLVSPNSTSATMKKTLTAHITGTTKKEQFNKEDRGFEKLTQHHSFGSTAAGSSTDARERQVLYEDAVREAHKEEAIRNSQRATIDHGLSTQLRPTQQNHEVDEMEESQTTVDRTRPKRSSSGKPDENQHNKKHK